MGCNCKPVFSGSSIAAISGISRIYAKYVECDGCSCNAKNGEQHMIHFSVSSDKYYSRR